MPYSIIALACAFAAAASAAEWFFIAALSAAMKKDIPTRIAKLGSSA
jgi:hypothetical protein